VVDGTLDFGKVNSFTITHQEPKKLAINKLKSKVFIALANGKMLL
jgi:hypothetical protein